MENLEKKRVENPKLVETITFRTTAERKLKLTQKAVELGKPLSAHCEDLICNIDEISEKENPEIKNNQMQKLYEMLEELLERNSNLQEQIKTLTEQQKPMTEIGKKAEKVNTTNESQNVIVNEKALAETSDFSVLGKITADLTQKEKEEFLKEFKKMSEYRIKKGFDKNEDQTVYSCIKYCYNWGAFFPR